MTIEEKAKAYDEAIERANAAYKDDDRHLKATLERIFPGLAESEDEKIRKSLVILLQHFCKGYRVPGLDFPVSYKDMLVWLEKQGKKDAMEAQSEEFDDNIITHDDEILQAISIGLTDIIKDFGCSDFGGLPIEEIQDWLERQGEQFQYWKPSEEQLNALDYAYNSCPDTERGNYYEGVLGNLIDDLHKLSEKQGKKNPDDKIEPKFNVGDWIIVKYMHLVMQILNNDNGSYKTVDTDGTERNDNYDFIESNHRLWTIEDTKDGDVLYSPEYNLLWIYKNEEQCHASINLNYEKSVSFGFDIVIPSDAQPATKEQCILLFHKIYETGYEWNTEKKELFKII